ncbi:MAG: hypothetical protein NWR22_03640, partial [Saprospiraceae bacterium]|nr:hypothetical protein [Saprospiraceae bacterium]
VTLDGILTTNSGVKRNITRQTTTYTILSTDFIIFGNTDAGNWSASLPAGVANTEYHIINTGTSGNILTVVPNGAEKIFGVNASFNLNDAESLVIRYNATDGWY